VSSGPATPPADLATRIASEIGGTPRGVAAVITLLDDGATIPFLARYRKEASGGLDEVQLRRLAERAGQLRELEARRSYVLATIEAQGKLDAGLRRRIEAAEDRATLEDLYLPYKTRRKTRASVAREHGLEPLALRVLAQPAAGDPRREAAAFVAPTGEVPDVEAALAGAHDIVVEVLAEDAALRQQLREEIRRRGVLRSKKKRGTGDERTRFEDYYGFAEPLRSVPSHRYLAVARGEAEGVLAVEVEVDAPKLRLELAGLVGLDRRSPFAPLLGAALDEALARRLLPSLGKEGRAEAAERAEGEAIEVFAQNLAHLLLAAPLGPRPVLAIDPGLRTGCKCVALDASGGVLEHRTLYPLRSERERPRAAQAIAELVVRHRSELVAVGNGTGGRETEQLARLAMKVAGLDVPVVSVSEAGASVYSASELAREELPELDVTIRGAVSIGRRLQDPLAELVKIDPQAIGVGQYQHDVSTTRLQAKLAEVVEACVNQVGVELSTASPALLRHVAGVGPKLAAEIVRTRTERGGFASRRELLEVKGLGKKAFEQCAGFVRLAAGRHPLDRSAVHPERYALVERMARELGVPVAELVGQPGLVARIDPSRYVAEGVGEPTLRDILAELARPGRDPRASFEAPRFREDVNALEDLEPGMSLEGVVTNVTAFGAFVDVGVHQDGLVHVSELAERFVRDPAQVVKVGDRVKVVVLAVDLERRRISLSRKRA
jgi:uncharacterized protein